MGHRDLTAMDEASLLGALTVLLNRTEPGSGPRVPDDLRAELVALAAREPDDLEILAVAMAARRNLEAWFDGGDPRRSLSEEGQHLHGVLAHFTNAAPPSRPVEPRPRSLRARLREPI